MRRLAAVDLYGSRGSALRRWVILAEFLFGVFGCGLLGVTAIRFATGFGVVIGWWLVGAAINYVPVAAHAITLMRPGALDAELSGVDVVAEQRYYVVRQLWVAVPLAMVAFALAPRRA